MIGLWLKSACRERYPMIVTLVSRFQFHQPFQPTRFDDQHQDADLGQRDQQSAETKMNCFTPPA
jgi:hypothetical protein